MPFFSFANWAMLAGVAAIAVPIALHFFFRSRYRTVPWAAMKFLLTSIEQTSRRLKFQELLLLLARCSVLALLAVALAQPGCAGTPGSGKGDPVDAVFLFDTSYSMGAKEGSGSTSRLDMAKKAALSILEQLPPHSTIQLIACADRAVLLGPRSPSDRDTAHQLIENLEINHLATDLLPGVTEAAAALKRGQSPNRELYVFSDMQKLGWEQQAAPLAGALHEVRGRAAIYLVRCANKTPANVAIVGVTPQGSVPRPGERMSFAVLVRNTGATAVEKLEVSLTVDEHEKESEVQALPSLAPGETRAVVLSAKLGQPGLRVVTARVKQDDLDVDNRFDQVIPVREHVRMLVIDGAPAVKEQDERDAASFYLLHGLLPVQEGEMAKWHLQATLIPPKHAVPGLLNNAEVCILANVALNADAKNAAAGGTLSPRFLESLAAWVRQGHSLMIFGGDNVNPEAYNRILGKEHGLLPLKLAGVIDAPPQQPLHFNRKSIGIPVLAQFRDDENLKGLSNVAVWKSLDVAEPAADRKKAQDKDKAKAGQPGKSEEKTPAPGKGDGLVVAMRYDNGKPAIVVRKVESGEVMFIATSAEMGKKPDSTDASWNDWALKDGLYGPFLQLVLSHLLHDQSEKHNGVAGEELRWHAAETDSARSFTLVTPAGKHVRLGLPEVVQGRPVVALKDLNIAGIYRLQGGTPPKMSKGRVPGEEKDKGVPFAVIPDLRESANLESLTDQQLDERLGFKPMHIRAGADPGSFSGTERSNQDWTLLLLSVVLAAVAGEAALAWFTGRAW